MTAQASLTKHLGQAVLGGALTAEQAVQQCLERIEERDGATHSFVSLRADEALAEARERDAEPADGPLHGVPFAVKDIFNTQDLPTEFMDGLDRINALADRAPGFVWRLQTDAGNATLDLPADWVRAGATRVHGCGLGIGERCGNANLTAIIPILLLKEPYASTLSTGITLEALTGLTRISRMLDEILNRVPMKQAAFVGSSAFAHKAGLHASAILKDPTTYEHIDPASVGNARIIPMSNQAGQSNLRERLEGAGLSVDPKDPALGVILERIKAREDEGYSYDTAQASFELLARRELGLMPQFFEVKRYRVTVERRKNKHNQMVSISEAVVVTKVRGEKFLNVSESQGPDGSDQGPVNALSRALAKDLGPYQDIIDDIELVDFKVRITNGGTEAVTRVIIDSEDGQGRRWSTVGVSANIVDASFEALLDAIRWKLVRDEATLEKGR